MNEYGETKATHAVTIDNDLMSGRVCMNSRFSSTGMSSSYRTEWMLLLLKKMRQYRTVILTSIT